MLLNAEVLLNYLNKLSKNNEYQEEVILDIIDKIESGIFDDDIFEAVKEKMWIFERIATEREYQDGTHEFPEEIRLSVLVEEVGEIAKELQEIEQGKNKLNLMYELIQTAAVCIRWVEMLEKEGK